MGRRMAMVGGRERLARRQTSWRNGQKGMEWGARMRALLDEMELSAKDESCEQRRSLVEMAPTPQSRGIDD